MQYENASFAASTFKSLLAEGCCLIDVIGQCAPRGGTKVELCTPAFLVEANDADKQKYYSPFTYNFALTALLHVTLILENGIAVLRKFGIRVTRDDVLKAMRRKVDNEFTHLRRQKKKVLTDKQLCEVECSIQNLRMHWQRFKELPLLP